MKYELENRERRGLMSKIWGPFSGSPDMTAAAKSGSPQMTGFRPTIPVSVPPSAGRNVWASPTSALQSGRRIPSAMRRPAAPMRRRPILAAAGRRHADSRSCGSLAAGAESRRAQPPSKNEQEQEEGAKAKRVEEGLAKTRQPPAKP